MVLNNTQAMLSVTCGSRVINFVPGTMLMIEKSEMDTLKKNRSFSKWCDDEDIIVGARAKKLDVTSEIEDAENNDVTESE